MNSPRSPSPIPKSKIQFSLRAKIEIPAASAIHEAISDEIQLMNARLNIQGHSSEAHTIHVHTIFFVSSIGTSNFLLKMYSNVM